MLRTAPKPYTVTVASDDGHVDAGHVPVLADQVLAFLDPHGGQVCLDCTAGRGGHASLIVPRLSPGGRYIGLDADADNVAFCRRRLADITPPDVAIEVVHASFTGTRRVLNELGAGTVDLLLADLGFSSNQVEDGSRGFSFQATGPLDMRFDRTRGPTAGELVNTLGEQELADLIYQYGQDRLSRKIAAKIVEERRQSPINDTLRLAQIVWQAYGRKASPPGRGGQRGTESEVDAGSVDRAAGARGRGRIDPATRTFMALRIAVNAELEALRRLLEQMPRLLGPGGVAAVISFHSLEDRQVKQAFVQWDKQRQAGRLTRKVVRADADERRANPRSRSAKLRVIRWSASAGLDG